MAGPSKITQLKRAIRSFQSKAALVVDIVGEITTHETAVMLLAVMEDLLADVRAMRDVAAERVIALTPRERRYPPSPVPGGGYLKFYGGKERTRYDQTALASTLASAIAEDVRTEFAVGHIVNTDGEDVSAQWPKIVHTVVTIMAEATGALAPSFTAWRSGVAKKYGIKLNDYAHLEDAPVTVSIEGRERR